MQHYFSLLMVIISSIFYHCYNLAFITDDYNETNGYIFHSSELISFGSFKLFLYYVLNKNYIIILSNYIIRNGYIKKIIINITKSIRSMYRKGN